MDLKTLLMNIDGETAKAFVSAASNVIDAMLFETARVGEMLTPTGRDYETAELSRGVPVGGWLSHEELRRTVQQMSEAVAAEKWAEGVEFAVRLLSKCVGT